MPIQKVLLDNIRLDGGTQYRDEINQDVVKDYADLMREGVTFPPVRAMYDGSAFWLYDGFHRYFATQATGEKRMDVEYIAGTQNAAQIKALSANADHGQPRNNATKRKVVQAALELFPDESSYEIAKRCRVSDTFVAAIRSPEVKAKQAENMEKHVQKKAKEVPVKLVSDSVDSVEEPSEEELEANELAMQADQDALQKLLDADDALATAHEEIKRLNVLNGQLQARINALMNEKNEAISLVKKLQKQVDKAKK
jgi:hypothetical protein